MTLTPLPYKGIGPRNQGEMCFFCRHMCQFVPEYKMYVFYCLIVYRVVSFANCVSMYLNKRANLAEI